jgi:hypothetical protein
MHVDILNKVLNAPQTKSAHARFRSSPSPAVLLHLSQLSIAILNVAHPKIAVDIADLGS